MRIKVSVTEADIRKGRKLCRGDKDGEITALCCPVALALQKAVNKGVLVEVCSNEMIYLNHREIKFPKSVSKFVSHFDEEEKGEPFEFSINVPKELLRASV